MRLKVRHTVLGGICALAVVGCCVPLVAGAVDWQKVDEDPDVRVHVDIDSVRRDEEIASAWVKFAYTAEQMFSGKPYRSNWMFAHFNCAQRRWAVGRGVLFSGPDLNGTRVFETEISEADLSWDPIARPSTADRILARVCGGQATATQSGAERLRIRAIAPDEATQFIRGEHWTLYLDGTIDAGADERLAQVIQEKGITAASVTLNSRGGDVAAGMGLGRVIRAAGFSTDVGQETAEPLASAPGVCFSACAFAYAGGGWRYLDEESKIGVHRVYREVARDDDLAAGQSVSGVITRYFSDMGVSTELFALMAQIPSEDLHVLTPEEARRLRLVNDGRGVPEWSIEASDAGFYLRGAQDSDSGPGKVVVACVGTGWVLMGFYSVTNAEEIVAGAVRASIRVDDGFVSLPGKDFYAKDGDVVGMADLAPATVERLRRASEIGFAFHPPNPEIFWGFAVEVGEFRERVERYFSACQAR